MRVPVRMCCLTKVLLHSQGGGRRAGLCWHQEGHVQGYKAGHLVGIQTHSRWATNFHVKAKMTDDNLLKQDSKRRKSTCHSQRARQLSEVDRSPHHSWEGGAAAGRVGSAGVRAQRPQVSISIYRCFCRVSGSPVWLPGSFSFYQCMSLDYKLFPRGKLCITPQMKRTKGWLHVF